MEKNKLIMIVIIVLLVVLLGTIAGVSIFALKLAKSASSTEAGTNAVGSAAPATKVLTTSEITTVPVADPISVNLTDSADGSSHSASVKVSVGVDNTSKKTSPAVIQDVTAQEVIIKDAVIGILRSKTVEDLSKPDSQELLKRQIVEKLQSEFNSNLIYDVYFDTYYYQ